MLAYTPDQYSAFWSGVTGITAVIAGAIGVLTLRALRQDSRDRSRPVVSAELTPVVLSHGTSELVIQNVGQSVAKDVKVTFAPEITEDMGQISAFLARRYSRIIPTMGPGRRLTNIYATWRGDGSEDLHEPVPPELAVTITYTDAHGYRYTDCYDISIYTLRNQTTSSPSNTDEAGMRRRHVQAVEAIARGVHRN